MSNSSLKGVLMNRREFFATAAAGVTAAGSAESEAEVTRQSVEAATTVTDSGRGTSITTDVSQLIRSAESADFVVKN